ncbi:unnamed protein product [Ectocarpus fasciculatus]
MPPAKDPDSLNRLKIVYGAMPYHLTPEYLKTERFVKQLKNLIPALEQVLEATAEVSQVDGDNDASRWAQEIGTLTKELNDLMSRGTPSKKGGGGGGRSAGRVGRANGGGSSSSNLGKRNSSGGGRASSGGGGKSSKRRKSSEAAGAGAATGAGGRPVKRSRSRR